MRVLLAVDEVVRRCIVPLLQASSVPCQLDQCSGLGDVSGYEGDIVLAEISLPDVALFDAMTILENAARGIPVIIVSKLNDERIATEAIRRGIQDFLPLNELDHRQLARSIVYALNRHGRNKGKSVDENGRSKACLPVWDVGCRCLRVSGIEIKRFLKPSPNQELVLTAFQEQAWERRILDPLPYHAELNNKERLRATIRSLNQRHAEPLLRFFGDGTGEAVCWKFRGENTRLATRTRLEKRQASRRVRSVYTPDTLTH